MPILRQVRCVWHFIASDFYTLTTACGYKEVQVLVRYFDKIANNVSGENVKKQINEKRRKDQNSKTKKERNENGDQSIE